MPSELLLLKAARLQPTSADACWFGLCAAWFRCSRPFLTAIAPRCPLVREHMYFLCPQSSQQSLSAEVIGLSAEEKCCDMTRHISHINTCSSYLQ